MPGGDRTGPLGLGSMTGRGAGYCAGNPGPGLAGPIPQRGFWGRGRGRRWFRPTVPTVSKEQELEDLRGQAEYVQENLDGIRNRIEELQGQGK